MTRGGGAIVAAMLLLLAPSRAKAGRADEIACQQRLIDLSGEVAGPGLAGSFAAMSGNYKRMALEGCSEDQRARAGIMVRVTRDLAQAAATIGDPLRRMERDPELRSNQAFLELQAQIEQFERRRQALREDLDRMIAANR